MTNIRSPEPLRASHLLIRLLVMVHETVFQSIAKGVSDLYSTSNSFNDMISGNVKKHTKYFQRTAERRLCFEKASWSSL